MPNFKAEYKIHGGEYVGYGRGGLSNEFFRDNFEFVAKNETEAVKMAIAHVQGLSEHHIADESGYCTIVINSLRNSNNGESIDIIKIIRQECPHIPEAQCRKMFPEGKYAFKKSWVQDYEKLKKLSEEFKKTSA